MRRAARDVTGSAYTSASTVEAIAKYTALPPAIVARSPAYSFHRDMRVDEATLMDMQRLFLNLELLSYKTLLPVSSLVVDP